jgi:hypothetical protein
MGTGFLSASQIALIKSVRSRAWNRPFTLLTMELAPSTDYYDAPTVLTQGSKVLSGDWAWRGQFENRGGEGGVVQFADLALATDIVHSGDLCAIGRRMIVDGITVAIVRATPYQDSGEIVVNAVRVV